MRISGELLRDMIISAANNIENNKSAVNDLNVFPVPDGDTGTNMSMTMSAAKREIQGLNNINAGEMADRAATALIKGARGNSGVILSLLFRGIARSLKGFDDADGLGFALAAKNGVEAAYKAVMKPTEGTILTVSRMSAEAAEEAAKDGADVLIVMSTMYEAAREALAKTPEMLPVLKQANVVDAGGEGYCIILEGMLSVLRDGVIIEAKNITSAEPQKRAAFESFDTGDIKFAYCTEFIVMKNKREANSDNFKKFLYTIGDSVVAVDDGDFIKVHVHTNNPGKAIEEALKLGYLSKIKIENMKEQHTSLTENTEPASTPEKTVSEPVKPEKQYGFVAVAAGEGFDTVFKDLGVDNMVEGGQTMNPSTDDILNAINKTPSEVVFVLPNNKNIIMAAEQAIPLTEKKVIVLPTKTVPQGISALFAFNPETGVEENKTEMLAAISRIKTASVTFAARDSIFDGTEIKEGQILGLIEGKVKFVEDDIKACCEKISEELIKDDISFVTVFYGKDVAENDAQDVKAIFDKKSGAHAEINMVFGGQPVYYYIISAE